MSPVPQSLFTDYAMVSATNIMHNSSTHKSSIYERCCAICEESDEQAGCRVTEHERTVLCILNAKQSQSAIKHETRTFGNIVQRAIAQTQSRANSTRSKRNSDRAVILRALFSG